MEQGRRRLDALLVGFKVWMADGKPPLRLETRLNYWRASRRAIRLAHDGGYRLLNADVRTIRYVLAKVPPHPASQNLMMSALVKFFDYLVAEGLRKDNPTAKLGRPRQLRTLPRPLAVEDTIRYLDAADALSPWHYAIAVLGIFMGLRRSEIISREWSDFFEQDGRWWADVIGKGGDRDREFVHPLVVRAVLRDLRCVHDDPKWLFPSPLPSRYGQHVSQSWVGRRHRDILDEAGLPLTIELHQLRHSFASKLRRVGGDQAIVQKALRHRSATSTAVYMEILPSEVAEHIEQVWFGRHGVPDVAAGGKAFEQKEDDDAGS